MALSSEKKKDPQWKSGGRLVTITLKGKRPGKRERELIRKAALHCGAVVTNPAWIAGTKEFARRLHHEASTSGLKAGNNHRTHFGENPLNRRLRVRRKVNAGTAA